MRRDTQEVQSFYIAQISPPRLPLGWTPILSAVQARIPHTNWDMLSGTRSDKRIENLKSEMAKIPLDKRFILWGIPDNLQMSLSVKYCWHNERNSEFLVKRENGNQRLTCWLWVSRLRVDTWGEGCKNCFLLNCVHEVLPIYRLFLVGSCWVVMDMCASYLLRKCFSRN